MTLVIGAKCQEGVLLIADTKVTLGNGKFKHDAKIQTPLAGTPVLASAAGLGNLFMEFNRKLPHRVNQTVREVGLKNEAYLLSLGLSIREIEEKTEKYAIEPQPDEKKEGLTEPVPKKLNVKYVYDEEIFLDDCKALIKEICSEPMERYGSGTLDVLVAVKGGEPRLHHINVLGEEEEIKGAYAIGSGAPFAEPFLDRLYNPGMNMLQVLSLAVFTIRYVENLNLDSGVGVEEHLPLIGVVLNDGKYGFLNESLESPALTMAKIDEKTLEFNEKMRNLQLPLFKLKKSDTNGTND